MSKVRIFTSFAIEDVAVKRLFVGQAKHDDVPYEFIDMSVKEPWDTEWKRKCRTKIKGCDGVIILISKHLKSADGALWEINCAKDERIPLLGVYMKDCNSSHAASELDSVKKIKWTWDGIADFVNEI